MTDERGQMLYPELFLKKRGDDAVKQCQISVHHIHFDKTMYDIFSAFPSESRVSVVTYKVRRVFSLEGSFNKINKFIFN